MVHALVRKILNVTALLGESSHRLDGRRLVIIGAHVQALNAQPLLNGEQLHPGKVALLLGSRLFNGPLELTARHKIRHANGRDPVEVLLAHVVHAKYTVLPPKSF